MWQGPPAEKAGVQEGDAVVSINNVFGSLDKLKSALQTTGERMRLIVRRNGKLMQYRFQSKEHYLAQINAMNFFKTPCLACTEWQLRCTNFFKNPYQYYFAALHTRLNVFTISFTAFAIFLQAHVPALRKVNA